MKSPTPIVSLGGIEIFTTAHPHQRDGYSYNIFTELRPVALPFLPKSNIIHIGTYVHVMFLPHAYRDSSSSPEEVNWDEMALKS